MFRKIILFICAVGLLFSCQKDEDTTTGVVNTDHYLSIEDFFSQNENKVDTHELRTDTVAIFRTKYGTDIRIEANSFVKQNGNPVTGNVKVAFKEVYTRSEMVFNRMQTAYLTGQPIKSAGMFYIKATSNDTPVVIAANKFISITQVVPDGELIDNDMKAFNRLDSIAGIVGWVPSFSDSLQFTVQEYIYKLYDFATPLDSGTWCNSDNSTYFSGYPMTHLNLYTADSIPQYATNVFLIFKGIRSMIHVYNSSMTDFTYNYAPEGFDCTIVGVGVRGGKLFACFKPLTITNNATVTFSLSEITTENFKSRLASLQ